MKHSSHSRSRIARQRGNTTMLVMGVVFGLVAIGAVVYWTMFRGGATEAAEESIDPSARNRRGPQDDKRG